MILRQHYESSYCFVNIVEEAKNLGSHICPHHEWDPTPPSSQVSPISSSRSWQHARTASTTRQAHLLFCPHAKVPPPTSAGGMNSTCSYQDPTSRSMTQSFQAHQVQKATLVRDLTQFHSQIYSLSPKALSLGTQITTRPSWLFWTFQSYLVEHLTLEHFIVAQASRKRPATVHSVSFLKTSTQITAYWCT